MISHDITEWVTCYIQGEEEPSESDICSYGSYGSEWQMFEMWKLSCLRRVNSHKASWWVCWVSLLALLGGPCAWWLAPVAARFVPSKKMETCWNSDETWTCLIYLRDLFLSLPWENTASKTQKRSDSIVGFVGSSAWMHSSKLQADMNQLNLFPTFRMIPYPSYQFWRFCAERAEALVSTLPVSRPLKMRTSSFSFSSRFFV